jgi:ATP-dependent protease ClpP protease subunit
MPNWGVVLNEIQKEKDDPPGGDSAVDKVRKKYLGQLYAHVRRNIICYYSGFLSKPRNIEGLEINDEDKNGFMLCVHELDKRRGLDLFLHSPGGEGAATQSLLHYLKEIFGNDVRAFVPQIAMSAGTVMALACKTIFMGKHSNLGPVDPQINGIQAYAVLAEIERAYKEITADNQRAWVWNPILSNYTGGFVQRCWWAKENVEEMVTGYLKANMLAALPEAERDAKALSIFNWLTELSANKGHDHHIHYEECEKEGLTIERLENPEDKKLQDLALTVHHCYMYALSNTTAFKIIENHNGRRWMKLQVQMQTFQFVQPPLSVPQPISPPH